VTSSFSQENVVAIFLHFLFLLVLLCATIAGAVILYFQVTILELTVRIPGPDSETCSNLRSG
jgi:hypothetical protein